MRKSTFKRIRQVPRDSTLVLAAIVSFIPFIFLTLFFIFNERALRASSQYGVLQYELAWTPKTIDRIFTAWGHANVQHQIYTHHVDNLYLFVYGMFALLCILLLARRLEGRLQQVGLFFVFTPVLAAVFDAMENVFLLSMLTRGAPGGWSDPVLASLCATFKIAFLGASIAFIFIAGVRLLARRYLTREIYFYLTIVVAGMIMVGVLSFWEPYLCYVIGPVYYAIVVLFIWISKRGSIEQGCRAD